MKKLVNNLSLIIASLFASIGVAFAESDSDFFAAAEGISVPTDETATGATAPASQTAENTAVQHGGNFLDSTKEFFSNLGTNIQHGCQGFTGKLQEFGNFIGEKLNGITGGNPLISKIAVALVLVLISVVIIVVLILIAKKFVHKTQSNPFQSKLFGNPEFSDIDNIEDIDDDDEPDTEEFTPQENGETTMKIGEQITSEEQSTLIAPSDISGAMKNFLNITE